MNSLLNLIFYSFIIKVKKQNLTKSFIPGAVELSDFKRKCFDRLKLELNQVSIGNITLLTVNYIIVQSINKGKETIASHLD